MTFTIPDEILQQASLTPEQLRLELAAYFYQKQIFSMGQARALAGLDLISFQKELSKRNIYVHFDMNDLKKDLKNMNIN